MILDGEVWKREKKIKKGGNGQFLTLRMDQIHKYDDSNSTNKFKTCGNWWKIYNLGTILKRVVYL